MPDVASDKENSSSGTASPKTSAKPIKNGLQCQITCLDGTVFSVVVEKDAKGADLLDKVFEHLNLVEKEYFSLQHLKGNKVEKFWLEPTKGIKKKLKNAQPCFDFGVKFFEPSPRDIKTDYTRYLMCLHLREDIATGKLTSSFIAQANLGAYFVQAELGDYDHREHSDDYLDGFVFAPNQTPELLEKIKSMHQSLRGMTPEEADLRYMETARELTLYGVDCHPAMDAESEYVCLGISFSGIHVYKDNTALNTIRWPTIEDVAYKGRTFTVKCRPGEFGDLITTLVYKLESEKAAKNCWKSCVEYHTFYRLKTPDPPPKMGEKMMRLGSKFRYSDRTLYQLRKERPGEKPGPLSPEKFQRVPSRHMSERYRGQPTEHVLHVVDKEDDPTRKRPYDNGEEEKPEPVSPKGKVYHPNEQKYGDHKKAPLMEEESMATMTPEEREFYREKMAKQIQKTTTTTTTTVLVIKNDGDDEGTQLEQSPIAKELEDEALMSKGVAVEGGSQPPRITELEDEEEEERRRQKEEEEERLEREKEWEREREREMQREMQREREREKEMERQEQIVREKLEQERLERERIERERMNGDRTYLVGGYVAGERPRKTHELQQADEDAVDVSYSTAVAGAAATPVRKEEEEEEEELEFMAFTAATPSTEEVKTAKRKTMDFDAEYDKGEVRRLEDDFNKSTVTTTKTVTTTVYRTGDDDYQGRPESPTLLAGGAAPYYQGGSETLPSRRPPPPVAPKRHSSADRLDDRRDEGYSKLITREELVRSYSPAGTLENEGQMERDTTPEIRMSLKDDLDLEHEQGESGFVLESVRKNEQIIDDISTQAEIDNRKSQGDLDDYQPPRPPPPLKPVDTEEDDVDGFPAPPPEVEETENGVIVTRTVTIEGSPQPQASKTEVIKTTTMPAEIITKTITIQGDGKPLTAQELSEIMALQSGPAGNFSPTETSSKTFTTTQQVRRVQKIDKVVTEKKIISADGTTVIQTGDPDTDAAIAKALEEARSAGADSTVTEVVVTKSDNFDSEV